MRRNNGRGVMRSADTHESDFPRNEKAPESLGFGAVWGGQRKPYPCPQDCPYPGDVRESLRERSLGEPLDIDDVALLLGCSPWTVRQKYLPQGLPHLRASASGKFVFFREQIVHWILERQEKGEWK
jgi:hypothetical protein